MSKNIDTRKVDGLFLKGFIKPGSFYSSLEAWVIHKWVTSVILDNTNSGSSGNMGMVVSHMTVSQGKLYEVTVGTSTTDTKRQLSSNVVSYLLFDDTVSLFNNYKDLMLECNSLLLKYGKYDVEFVYVIENVIKELYIELKDDTDGFLCRDLYDAINYDKLSELHDKVGGDMMDLLKGNNHA